MGGHEEAEVWRRTERVERELEAGRRGESGRHEGLTGEDAGVDIRVCWNGEDVSGRGKEKRERVERQGTTGVAMNGN